LAQGGDYLWFVKDNQATLNEVVAILNNFVIALAAYLGFSNLASAQRDFQAKFDALIFSAL